MTSAERAYGFLSRSTNSAGVKKPVFGNARESTAFWNAGEVSGRPTSCTARRARPRCAHTSSTPRSLPPPTNPNTASTGCESLATRLSASSGRSRSPGVDAHSPAEVRPVARSTRAHPAAIHVDPSPRSRCTAMSTDDEAAEVDDDDDDDDAVEAAATSGMLSDAASVARLMTSATARRIGPAPFSFCCGCCMYKTTVNPASTSIGTYLAIATRGTPPNVGLLRETWAIDLFLRVTCTPIAPHTRCTSAPSPLSQPYHSRKLPTSISTTTSGPYLALYACVTAAYSSYRSVFEEGAPGPPGEGHGVELMSHAPHGR